MCGQPKCDHVVSNHTDDLAGLAPCGHKEADTRICVHVRHATKAGSKVIKVIAIDTPSRYDVCA